MAASVPLSALGLFFRRGLSGVGSDVSAEGVSVTLLRFVVRRILFFGAVAHAAVRD